MTRNHADKFPFKFKKTRTNKDKAKIIYLIRYSIIIVIAYKF